MICTKCNTEKPDDDFSFRYKDRGIRLKQCKTCMRNYINNHYSKHPDYYKDKATIRNHRVYAENCELIFQYLKQNPCVDCGETDTVVLDFDHRDPDEKEYNIAVLMKNSWSSIEKEINKCDIRCANCHRRRHAKSNGTFRYRRSTGDETDPKSRP